MRIAIIDIARADRTRLLEACARWALNHPTQPFIETFSEADTFLHAWRARQFDLVIVDCAIGTERGGFNLVRTMRERNDDTAVVLTSQTPVYALEGYDVGAVGYLPKPVSLTRLRDTLDRVVHSRLIDSSQEPIRLSAQSLELLLEPRSVALVQAHNHYVDLLFSNGREIRVRKSFSSIREALCDLGPFFQSARGVLVNLSYVKSLDGSSFILFNGRSTPSRRPTSARPASAIRPSSSRPATTHRNDTTGGTIKRYRPSSYSEADLALEPPAAALRYLSMRLIEIASISRLTPPTIRYAATI